MTRLLLLSCLLLLGACTSRAPLPAQTPTLALPLQLHVQRKQAGERQDWMLVIQREQNALRWSLLDFLGIPAARQLLDDGHWHADGLLPPNPQAREMFAALLFALTPEAQLAKSYPQARQQGSLRTLGERWQVSYQQPTIFTVTLEQGLRYVVSPLNNETAP